MRYKHGFPHGNIPTPDVILLSLMTLRIIASDKNWIESDAITQLEKTFQLPGMHHAVGMPDLHPGKGAPIGAVFASRGIFYPHLVGNDIGCGMGFWQTDIAHMNIRLDKWVAKLRKLEDSTKGMGTIGGGNHFAELQKANHIYDLEEFEKLSLDRSALYLLVHTGSRGLGEEILRAHTSQFGTKGLIDDSQEAQSYLSRHDSAVSWAIENRKAISDKFASLIGAKTKYILDVCHNQVLEFDIEGNKHWLHRKGAAPSNCGPFVIPGSRGTLSYLAKACGEQRGNLYSVAHGAGRKWQRSDCRARLKTRYTAEQLRRTKLGGRVICDDKELLYQEAPEAYKNIDVVVEDLVNENIISLIASFTPIITYKNADLEE